MGKRDVDKDMAMFEGVYTALITPFKNGTIDYASLEKLVEMQIGSGIDGVVPLGTTGESPTLSFDEHREYVKRIVGLVGGRVKVIAGTGANSTDEAVWLSLLQQADPARAYRAFRESGEIDPDTGHPLQHTRPHGREFPAGQHQRAAEACE
jgi:hypothetical protein